jgi:hypothetical protein
MMPANLELLMIEDLKMLLRLQHEKAAREAEVKRLVEEAACLVVAEETAQQAEEEAKAKARKASGSEEMEGHRGGGE